MPIVILATPVKGRPGHFTAHAGARLLCSSTREPFLAGARRLLELGYEPKAVIVLRGPGSTTDRLRSTVGSAARLTVEESDRRSPRFRLWKAPPAREGSPFIAPIQNSDVPVMEAAE
jgi:hypothetical protein